MLIFFPLPSGVGYYIFRKSNSQKNQFRRDPSHPSVASQSCCNFGVFNVFSKWKHIFCLTLLHIWFLEINLNSRWIYDEEETAFPLSVRMKWETWGIWSEVTCTFLSTTTCRTWDHCHSNGEEAAGLRLVGSRSSSQLPRWPPHGPGVVPAMW